MAPDLTGPGPVGAGPVRRDLLRPAAVLLDLDGTLLDSEPLWSAAARASAERYGCAWSVADDTEVVGWSIPALVALLKDRGVPGDAGQIAAALHDDVGAGLARGLPWRAGALDLLTLVRWLDVPCALVTASDRSLAAVVVEAAPRGALRAVVAGDDVVRPKPHPESYLTAALVLGVDPASCLAVEDSPTGVASALAAGMLVLAVDPAQTLPPHLAQHRRLVPVAGLVPVIEILGGLLARD